MHFEKPNDSSWIKKSEVLNGPVLQIFFRTGPKGPEVRWYTKTYINIDVDIGRSLSYERCLWR